MFLIMNYLQLQTLLCRISFSKLNNMKGCQRQDELDIKCLQILRAIIHNQIMLIDPELKESSPAEYRRSGGNLSI